MKGIQVTNDFVDRVLAANGLAKVNESAEVKAEEVVVEEAGVHVCPLCESSLNEAISQEKIEEHVNYILGILEENVDEGDGEDLDEELESDEEAEEA